MLRFKTQNGEDYPLLKKRAMGDLTIEHKERNKMRLPLEIYSVNNTVGFIPQSEQFEDAGYLHNTNTSIYMVVPPNHFAYNPARIDIGSIGYQNVGCDVQVSSLYEVFRTTDEVDDNYLWHWFHTKYFNNMVKRLQEGGVRLYYYYDKLAETKIMLPCLEEQQKIADCLSSVDAVIADCEAQVENMQNQKKGVMQKLFSQEVRFKNDDGSEYPEWKSVKLGDILTICHGKDYKHLGSGNIPVMGTGGIITYVDESLCDWECVCIGRKGTIDRPYYMNSPFWSVDTLFYSKPHDGQVVKFQYYLFETINWKQYNEASGVPSLSASTIESIKILIPEQEEQQQIADCLTAFDDAIEDLQNTVEHWKNIKKGLLQQLFA